MYSDTFQHLLDRTAEVCGIHPEYWDIFGKHHVTSAQAKQEILEAMGVSAKDAGCLEQSAAERAIREWERLLPPAVVASTGPVQLLLSLPVDQENAVARFTIRPEGGGSSEFELSLAPLPKLETLEWGGHSWVRKQVALPLELPLGYHDISVQVGYVSASTRYIVTPDRAWAEPSLAAGGKAAGIAVSLYGVRSDRNWGCGDFTDLLDLTDWVAKDLDASFIALNPLHAIHNRRPFNTSPYLPNCIFYQNFLYLDVEAMEDFTGCRRAQQLRQSPEVIAEIQELRNSPYVEYERVAALKLRFLKPLFLRFMDSSPAGSPRRREFEQYLEREGDLLEKYATYCALDEVIHRRHPDVWTWKEWPLPYQDPDSAETRQFRERHWRRVMFYQYLQWQIDGQLAAAQQRTRECGLPIGLYHDLALATDRFGSDLWAHRPFFIEGCRVGSPPDDFSPKGQDWAFPPPDSARHREDGYRLYAASIRKNCRHGGALRIDHVMRLFRLYWIPDSADSANGAYVREQSDDMVRILALESVRNQVLVVGEDLGTVEPAVRETLARFGIFSYRLFYFEKNGSGGFRRNSDYPAQALVSSTTHDLPTLAGFWTGADIEARRAAGVLDDEGVRAQFGTRMVEKQKMLDVLFELGLIRPDFPRNADAYPELTGELHNAVIGFLAGTPSQLLAINHEDLTKEPHQQNLPGTTWQYPNWGRKMRYTLEQLRSDPEARGYTQMLHNWIVSSGRNTKK